ncbi:Hint domain-containing protein [Celeribacter indicus]|uniref:Hemolysin-type calcium-binding region n=1 Tax=Celeribacter indicus TaxID=1208324 RepID=A0A0B5DY93_9RHOB|nr:Hint domain-containing protein [Celeribacter indicus]AJE48423.1 hemolysin-type calcium-binding region [Celeribacter indicus]
MTARASADSSAEPEAKDLCGCAGIAQSASGTPLEYWHIAFARHEIVLAEGVEAESLHFGPEALRTLHPDGIEELRCLFGARDFGAGRGLARREVRGSRARRLVERITMNGHALQDHAALR